MSRCRSCHAEVFYAVHLTTGKEAPIDANPTPAGNVIVLSDGHYYVLRRGDPTPPKDVARYTAHYSTCPQAEAWRRRQKQAAGHGGG
jgi:hypothetical protein